jgi:hypothetical protein
MTKRGKMAFEKIPAQTEELLIYLTDNSDIVKHYTPKGQFMVAAEGDQAVQLMFYLQGLNEAYITTRVPGDGAFRSKTGIDTVENFVGRYLSIDGGRRVTTAFIGSCEVSTPELKELMLTAIEETYDPEKAESFRKLALDLEESME